MSISMYESQVKSARSAMDSARDKQSREEQRAAKLGEEARKLRERASKSNSSSMATSQLRQASTKERDASKAAEKAASYSADVSRNQSKVTRAESKLADARATDERRTREKATRERKQLEQRQKQEQERRDREERQRAALTERRAQAQANEIARLTFESEGLREELENVARAVAPPSITVLFWASSPEDEAQLRLDKEAREIERRVRLSEHRDSLRFEHRSARQLVDLLQDLNETKPDVVHFSGHGSSEGLAFEDDAGRLKVLLNSQLAALLHTMSDRARLVVFNSCESTPQAELATESIDLAIGMNASVEDARAKTFAAQLYGALGFGHSVQTAFDQATAAVTVEHGTGGEIPHLFAKPGVDPATTILVNPNGD